MAIISVDTNLPLQRLQIVELPSCILIVSFIDLMIKWCLYFPKQFAVSIVCFNSTSSRFKHQYLSFSRSPIDNTMVMLVESNRDKFMLTSIAYQNAKLILYKLDKTNLIESIEGYTWKILMQVCNIMKSTIGSILERSISFKDRNEAIVIWKYK